MGGVAQALSRHPLSVQRSYSPQGLSKTLYKVKGGTSCWACFTAWPIHWVGSVRHQLTITSLHLVILKKILQFTNISEEYIIWINIRVLNILFRHHATRKIVFPFPTGLLPILVKFINPRNKKTTGFYNIFTQHFIYFYLNIKCFSVTIQSTLGIILRGWNNTNYVDSDGINLNDSENFFRRSNINFGGDSHHLNRHCEFRYLTQRALETAKSQLLSHYFV